MRIESTTMPFRSGAKFNAILRSEAAARPRDRFPFEPSLAGLEAAAATIPRATVAATLAAAITTYNHGLGHDPGAEAAAKLAHPDVLVVATGQQPGLLGGTLLVAAKAAGACAIARELEARLSRPVVPLFWIHSEDHDLAEVNRFEVFESGSLAGRSIPVADHGRCLDRVMVDAEGVSAARALLQEIGCEGTEALAAREGESWSSWSARCLLTELRDLPLVYVEPRVVRPFLSDFFVTMLDRGHDIAAAIAAGTAATQAAGVVPQVAVSDRSQLFVLDEDGTRRRYLVDGGGVLSPPPPGGSSGAALRSGILALARRDPLRLSTTALSRPLALQSVLPVVAHVNGPAEISYFAQLPEAFRALGLPIPAVVPRPSLTILRPKENAVRESLRLSLELLLGDPSAWPEPAGPNDLSEAFGRARAQLGASVAEVAPLAGTDPGLERAIHGFRSKITEAVDRLETTFTRDRERAGEVGRAQRHRLAAWVRPRGRPQERELSPLLLLRGDAPDRISRILAALPVFDHRHHVVTLEAGDA